MNVLSILVVEDDEGIQNLLRRLLTREGHRVTVVGSGQEALRVVPPRSAHWRSTLGRRRDASMHTYAISEVGLFLEVCSPHDRAE